jgi:type I restriction enzyme, S subunit
MSRFEDLIAKLCPHGVPIRPLGEVGTFIRGRRFTKADQVDEGLPSIHYGEIYTHYGVATTATISYVRPDLAPTLRFARPGDVIIAAVGETVEDVGKALAWVGTDQVAIHDDCFIFRSSLDPKYVVYFMQSDAFNGPKEAFVTRAKVKRLSADGLAKLRIPVPPLEVQHEIVRILDLFMELETQIEVELEARRRQHAFYWASLLTPRDGWRTTTLGEVAEVFDGPHATPKKTDIGPWYLSISSLKNGRFDLTESAHLSEDEFSTWTRRVAPRFGDTMFSYETRVGQAAYWDKDEPAALGRRMGLLRPRTAVIDPRFLTLVYLGPQFQKLIEEKTVHGSTVDRIPIADMAAWETTIPALTEQKRIVDLLDKFDALVNDLSSGLPAELNARRKQYGYYRDRLLTFKELAA